MLIFLNCSDLVTATHTHAYTGSDEIFLPHYGSHAQLTSLGVTSLILLLSLKIGGLSNSSGWLFRPFPQCGLHIFRFIFYYFLTLNMQRLVRYVHRLSHPSILSFLHLVPWCLYQLLPFYLRLLLPYLRFLSFLRTSE